MVSASLTFLLLLPLLINAVLSLPLLSDSNREPNRGAGTLTMQQGPSDDESLQTLHWLKALLLGGGSSIAASQLALNEQRPRLQQAPRDLLLLPFAKRNDGKIPTMGLGVLSDMRKFFNELRTNLDSVEEVAALSQEQGGPLNPADFLALLAKHGAKLQVKQGSSGGDGNKAPEPASPSHLRRLMLGYTNDDQPYAHSGLGK